MSEQQAEENQNLIDGTPLYTFVCTVQEKIKEAHSAKNSRFGQSFYADVRINMDEVKKIYEDNAIEELKSKEIEAPAFMMHGFKAYLDATLIKNIRVELPFKNGPSTVYLYENNGTHYRGYGGCAVYFPVNCADLNGKKAYMVAVIMPLLPITEIKKSNMECTMTLSKPMRDLQSGVIVPGFNYGISVHGFYAANESELAAEIPKTVNYCIGSPNENFGRHSVKSDIPMAFPKKQDIESAVTFLTTLDGFKGNPLTELSLTDTNETTDEEYVTHMAAYEKVKEKFVYKPENIKCYRSANTPIQPIIFDV
jgi:hypothetical protein